MNLNVYIFNLKKLKKDNNDIYLENCKNIYDVVDIMN